ncbi:uncharacterized protein LOC111871303 isoform X2 [Cryptotermes secundus]|nr:uncharacterized protein LOC111871303 isoform X2 [Cryptotermes secundus]
MKPRSRQIRVNSKRRKTENSVHRDSNRISGRRVCPTKSRTRKIKNSLCRNSDIAAERRKICSSASYFEKRQQSAAYNFEPSNNTGGSCVSANVVNRHRSQVSYAVNVTVIKKSVGVENLRQCCECGGVAMSVRTLKKYHLTMKPLCLVCWKTESKLRLRSSMNKECFVRLTDVMKTENFQKLISHNKEVFEHRVKRKHTNGTELCPPHKFMQKNVGQPEPSRIVERPRRELKTTTQECKKSISYIQENLIDSKNCMKQDIRLLQFNPEVISSSRKSLNTSKTFAYALRHDRKRSPEVLASVSKTRLKQTTRSVSSKLSVTYLKPKPIVPYTCSVCLTKFSQLKDGKIHDLKHSDRFPVLVLKRCKMPFSQVSAEASKACGSEAHETGSTGVNTRSKHDKAVQVNFANESEAQQTGSTGVNTRSKHDKAVQVTFSDERENHRSRQNIIDNKCGQEAATAGISTKRKYQEALQINFPAKKYQQGLQIVIPHKNKHKGINGGPVIESECEEAVESGINERGDKDTDESAKDFNGDVTVESLFHVKTSKVNKDDEVTIEEGIGGEFHESIQEKDGGHSSEVHTNEFQEAVGSEFHANVQAEEEEDRRRNYGIEADMNGGKEAVIEDVQAHVAREDDQGGSYTDRAEINENVQTDVAEDHKRHYTNVAGINSDKEDTEREYHEGVPADVSEDDQGGSCKSRACINEGKVAIENIHHEGVEMDVADGDDEQIENYLSEGDKNEGLESVESEYYIHVQANVAEVHANESQEAVGSECHANVQAEEEEEDRRRNYGIEADMNGGKEAVVEDVQAHVAKEDDQGGSYTDRAEINENVQTDVAEDHKRHYTNVTGINSGKEDTEREYHEGVPADVSEDDQGGSCKSRACINEGKVAIENTHHEGVEMDVADGDDEQIENYLSEGDKNEGLESVESEYYIHVQADVAEEHQVRNYVGEDIMNEAKEVVESEYDIPAYATEEDKEGKYTNKDERNEVQNSVESEFYEAVYVEFAEVVVQGGSCTPEADVNI